MPTRPYRCIYWSRNRVDGADEIVRAIDSILVSARHNNRLLGITGALAFDRGLFAQFLEGEIRAVELVFEKIQRDERHGDIQVLAFGPASKRAFRTSPMAFLGRTPEEHRRFVEAGDDAEAGADRIEAQRLLDIVRTLGVEDPDPSR
ncbi:BLUF domain-containing protein [Rhodopseudomonas telluris]|uniref:BLUF domain-containing protein n=1 Tax=Rhodopseudomonas telluris TaxID=644215 RepID=A0ABV6EQ85_9BRAD